MEYLDLVGFSLFILFEFLGFAPIGYDISPFQGFYSQLNLLPLHPFFKEPFV